MCNIGNLLLAVGLFFEQAVLIRVAVIWLVPGVFVWLAYVVPTWGTLLTGGFSYRALFGVLSSTLAHLGGVTVGIAALRRIGVDGRAWLHAFLGYFIVQLISRLATPAALNVNISHAVQAGWEQTFSTYLRFWLALTLLVGVCLWIIGLLLKLLWPVSLASSEARAL